MVIYSHPAFQSTLPRRERHETAKRNPDPQNFNPRSREGSDTKLQSETLTRRISIHAPAKGATHSAHHRVSLRLDFNPRSREGSDYDLRHTFCTDLISIHAPAKGATGTSCGFSIPPAFQSTLPRRERPPFVFALRYSVIISIHAPAKGATARETALSTLQDISIHAPAKGATLPLMPNAGELNHFNPRSREGSDFGHRLAHQLRKVISIHAPAKGATAIPVPVP